MIYKARVSATIAFFIAAGISCSAQMLPKKKSVSTSKTSSAEQGVVQIQRDTAIHMITLLANEANTYKDETLRVQVQARAADTLWIENPALSREIFLRAWTIAEKVDKEGERSANAARTKATGSRDAGLVILTPISNLRMEVLKLAAKRDSDLAEKLLARLDVKDDENTPVPSRDNTSSFDPMEPSIAIAKRLEVASTLLETDLERALAFAQPALKEVTSPGIIFLCRLRRKNLEAADKLYSQLLTHANNDAKSDATSVSLLTTYIFTPNLIVTATKRGRIMNPFADEKQSVEFSPALRSAFIQVAANILLRPLPLPDQDLTSAGRAGTFFTINRLLPLFEQYAPSKVSSLKTQMLMLASDVPETWKNEDDIMLRAGLASAKVEEKAPSESLEQQLAKAATSSERDFLYVKAIQAGATNGDMRIRDFAAKIEDSYLKEQARSFADLAVVRHAIEKKDSERVLRIVHEGYLTPLHRVWAQTAVASILGKDDLTRALDLISEASAEAMRIKIGEPSRVYALICVAQSLMELDKIKTQDIAFDVVKSLNAVTDFNADGGKLYAQVRAKNLVAMINAREQSFNMSSFFERMSKQDLPLAISLANDVKPDAPRATATLAIANLILRDQSAAGVSMAPRH